MCKEDNYIPEGYYVVEDVDGERLVKKALEQAAKDTEAIRKAERAGEHVTGETMGFRMKENDKP